MPVVVSQFLGRQFLGRRLVTVILIVNVALAIIATIIQIYQVYDRERTDIVSTVQSLDNSVRKGLEEALFENSNAVVEALLEGIITNPDIEYVELKPAGSQVWMKGQRQSVEIVDRLELFHSSSDVPLYLGTLSVGVSLNKVEQKVIGQFHVFIMINLVKAFITTFFMLFIFNFMVSRYLRKIAAHVSLPSWILQKKPLMLERSLIKRPSDELDLIVDALNEAVAQNYDSFQALQEEIKNRVMVEQHLEKTVRELHSMNQEQSEFTYALSHDLKSPMNSVLTLLLAFSEEEKGRISKSGQHIIDLVQSNVVQLNCVIDDVAIYAKLVRSGIQVVEVNLQLLIADVWNELTAKQRKSATLEVGEIPSVMGDEFQLRILFRNMLLNSCTFGFESRQTEITVSCNANADLEKVYVTVRDNGIGIDERYFDRIFGLFQRLHLYSEYPGSGLGLTLCKRIIENHNGSIALDSKAGEWTAFTIGLARACPALE